MYCGVPNDMPVSVMRAPALLAASAMPKSATSAEPSWQHDVFRLDVAMDHAVAMCVVQRRGDLGRDAHGVGHGQLLLAREPLAKRDDLDERHHLEQQSVGFSRIEQRKDVRMLQGRRRLDLG